MAETIPCTSTGLAPQTGDIFSPSLADLLRNPPSASRLALCRKELLSRSLEWPLHRVKVLEGHTGCVNALSWTSDGETLISGGDDKTVRFWRMPEDKGDPEDEYPFVCYHEIQTGHWNNIFSAKMLPFSTRLATAARDGLVKVFDVGAEVTTYDSASPYSKGSPARSGWEQRTIRCHSKSVKRVTTELSPDVFLTVSEDGTVRQHDLRGPPHRCGGEGTACSTPLVKVSHPLFSMSIPPSAPHQLVVAGDNPYGYLFDRRQIGRLLQAEWGVPVEDGSLTTCVRRFATEAKPSPYDYITAARVSSSNGHEVILSYGGNSVHLFSILDDPTEVSLRTPSPVLPPNPKNQKTGDSSPSARPDDPITEDAPPDHLDVQMDENGDREERDEEEEEDDAEKKYSKIPLVLPRRTFKGISNLRTIKDVNFVGPNDEFVASGSDDGYFFLWRRESGALHGIYEGDESVVNVIEPHPTLPLIAVSGIDHEPKLFSPRKGADEWSRLDRAENIINNNMDSVVAPPMLSFLQSIRVIVDATSGTVDRSQCTHQ